jgi:hypothetical protein
VALLDLVHDRLPLVAEREAEELFEAIGDARQSGMNDDRPQPCGEPIAQHCADVLPVRDRGNARAAELEHDPRRGAGRRISHRHCVYPSPRGIQCAVKPMRRPGRSATG